MNTLSATDLRIGNLVYRSNRIKKVTTLDIQNIIFNYSKYRPIELTEKWFLKTEFRIDRNGHYWKPSDVEDHYLELIYSDGYYYPAWVTIPELLCESEQRSTTNRIQYLHQLQNLWKELSGEELTFEK